MIYLFIAQFAFSLLSGIPQAYALSVGDVVKDFSAVNQDGKEIHFSRFKGKPVIVYFYPKDDTPGCTREACEFRNEYSKFKKLGASVLGVSSQDQKSHREFKAKHSIPFDLLVDTDGRVAEIFGMESFPLLGLHKRQSVLVDASGKVFKIYRDVDPKEHAKEVLKDLKTLKNAGK